MRCLLDPEICVRSQSGGIGDARHQQGKRKVVAPVDRQIGDILLGNCVGQTSPLSFHHRGFRVDLDHPRRGRQLQVKIHNHGRSHRQNDTLLDFALKAGNFHSHVISCWWQSRQSILPIRVSLGSVLNAFVGLHCEDRRLRDARPRWITYGPGDVAGGAHSLRAPHTSRKHQAEQKPSPLNCLHKSSFRMCELPGGIESVAGV